MRAALISVSLLAASACTEADAPQPAAVSPETIEQATAPAPPPAATGAATNHAGGLSDEGTVVRGKAGEKHMVRLPSPGTDT